MDFKSLGAEETTLKTFANNVLSATGYGEGACIYFWVSKAILVW